MKKIRYITALFFLLGLISCSEEFLDTKQLYESSDESFYSNPEQIQDALTSAYSKLTNDAGADNFTLIASIKSDDRFAGAGVNDYIPHDDDWFTDVTGGEDAHLLLWQTQYEGIFRTNMIISRFEQAEYDDEAQQNQDIGEAHFLRAFFYFRLAQGFGEVPLLLDPAPVDLPKASAEDIYAQIAFDLKKAIELMTPTPFNQIPEELNGHATKWAAQGMMARVFLFYTGYYGQSELPLPEGGTVSKAEVIAWIDNCVEASGHDLVADFRNLWPYTAIPSDYAYSVDNNLSFALDGNIETVFAVKYASFGGWNLPNRTSYANQSILYQGLRTSLGIVPFGTGWGFGTVNPQLWESFEDGDIRQQGSILNVVDDVPGEESIKAGYIWGGELGDAQDQETGHWSKKGLPVVTMAGGNQTNYYTQLYGGQDNMQLSNMQDEIILRFADILLMGAELGSGNAQTYMDLVRRRAGLDPVGPTLENIKMERRHELAFEGLRFFDLLRWGDAASAFAVATNIPVKQGSVDQTYTVTFNPDRVFLKIPESQVRLSNGQLTQSPGWE